MCVCNGNLLTSGIYPHVCIKCMHERVQDRMQITQHRKIKLKKKEIYKKKKWSTSKNTCRGPAPFLLLFSIESPSITPVCNTHMHHKKPLHKCSQQLCCCQGVRGGRLFVPRPECVGATNQTRWDSQPPKHNSKNKNHMHVCHGESK